MDSSIGNELASGTNSDGFLTLFCASEIPEDLAKIEPVEFESRLGYHFPISARTLEEINEKITMYDPNHTLSRVEGLSYDEDPTTGKRYDYSTVRGDLLAFGLALNIMGVVPPRFRKMRTPPFKAASSEYSTENSYLSNDRQVIDMHWIYCKKMSINSITGYTRLFDFYKPFDLAGAAKLASVGGKSNRKATLMGLSEFDELQLASIGSQETKTRWKTIDKIVERDQKRLRDYADKPKRRLPANIKTALPNIYKALLIGRGSASLAVKAYRFMTTISIPLKQMQRYKEAINSAGIDI